MQQKMNANEQCTIEKLPKIIFRQEEKGVENTKSCGNSPQSKITTSHSNEARLASLVPSGNNNSKLLKGRNNKVQYTQPEPVPNKEQVSSRKPKLLKGCNSISHPSLTPKFGSTSFRTSRYKGFPLGLLSKMRPQEISYGIKSTQNFTTNNMRAL